VLIIGCSLFVGDCRQDSFAGILRLFQAEKRSTLYLPERESVIINWAGSLLGVQFFFSVQIIAERTSSLTVCVCFNKDKKRSCRFVRKKSDQ